MSLHFSANQYEAPFKPSHLCNWESPPKWFPKRPQQLVGYTEVIGNNSGHQLPGIRIPPTNPWGNYLHTWQYPQHISRALANQLADTPLSKYHARLQDLRAMQRRFDKFGLKQLTGVKKTLAVTKVRKPIVDPVIEEPEPLCPVHKIPFTDDCEEGVEEEEVCKCECKCHQ